MKRAGEQFTRNAATRPQLAVRAGVFTAAGLAAVTAFTATPAAASAYGPTHGPTHAPGQAATTRIAAHFDLARGQLPENVALEPDGTADVTFAAARQVAAVTPKGAVRVLATLPAPADGGVHTPALGFPLTTGIVRTADGTLYFLYATGTPDLTGLWRLRPHGTPRRIAALPADGLPNGLALDARAGRLYIADSVRGTISTVPLRGGQPSVWSAAPELASTGFLGANGLKVHNGAVWATNLDKGTVLRIPLRPDGRPGPVRTRATGLPGIDDFTFTGPGDEIVAALNGPNAVVRIGPDGTSSTVLTAADGLQGPTSVALYHRTLYVLSAAYTTATDPNLLLTRPANRPRP